MAQKSAGGRNSSEEFISLQDVLYSFNNSISEEQAWAVCYQCAQYFEQNSSQDCYRDLYYYGIIAIRISKEGDVKVDVNFNQGTGKGPPRKRSSFSLSREFKTVITPTDVRQALGTAIYKALDYGLSESEEPHLSAELEALIESLTEDHPTDDDEGIDIERDSDQDIDDSQGCEQSEFLEIIDSCTRRLSSQQNAQLHYKAVCRALATEATELVTFLDNIVKGQEKLASTSKDKQPSVDDLERSDWARLWVQIMRELRHGVRLKKVEQVHLLPLEFELTPFEILLEDIRLGRYKLNRIMVNRRKLKALPQREMDPRELLLEDIRKPQNLKPVKHGKLVVRKPTLDCDTNYSSDEDSPKPVRKVIKPVAAFQVSTDDSDSYFSDPDDDYRNHISAPVMSPLDPVYPDADDVSWKSAVARDLVRQPSSNCRSVVRRHTISACDVKSGTKHKWQNPIECLSLTLEEVTHIRCVLTKAELESLITNPELHSQVSKGKVCFTCKKTKFSLFGQWGTKCKFCLRTVCNYCLRKMSVPTEHFEKIPVYTLSPVPLSPEMLEALKVYESTGSVPHSPITNRKFIDTDSNNKTVEEPVTPVADENRAASRRKSLQRSHTIGVGVGSRPPPNKALLKGPQMSICCDCKSMIMEIIRASRSSVSLITGKSEAQEGDKDKDSLTPRGQVSARSSIVMRPRHLDLEERPRPRSMLDNFSFKSFNFSKTSTDA